MIPIKIHCQCGQRYSFDVEPVSNEMPYVVACPTCGADGTDTANQQIAQATPRVIPVAQPAASVRLQAAVPARAAVALATPVVATRPAAPLPHMDRTRAENEARSKIFWGDDPDDVVKFLMMQAIPYDEAEQIVSAITKERSATTRANGIRKILIGAPLMCVPVGAWIVFANMGFFPVKIFAFAVLVGLYGVWQVFNGCWMLLVPNMEGGDVADQ
jgi:hypothetical protein